MKNLTHFTETKLAGIHSIDVSFIKSCSFRSYKLIKVEE